MYVYILDFYVKMDFLGYDMFFCRGKGKESRRIFVVIIIEEYSSFYYCDGYLYSWLLRISIFWLILILVNERFGVYIVMFFYS